MSFSNPATLAKANADRYVADLMAALGGRDPWEVRDELLPWLRQELAGLAEADLRRPEAPGKWSVLQVVQHLADTELVYGFRLRMIVAHDNPPIQGYDQDRWADSLHYDEVSLADAIAQLDLLRRLNDRLVKSLTPDGRKRTGLHEERGPESVDRIIEMLAAHDLVHRAQILRVKDTLY